MKIMCVNNRIYSDSTIYSNGRHSYAHNNIKRAEPKLQQLQADTISFSGGFIPKSSLTTVGKRLFRNIEEFQSNLLEKLTKFQGKLPPELYSAVEKNISDGSFTIGEIVKAYYAGLKDCKSLAQAKKMYPEIPVTDYSPVKEIKKILRNSLPQDVCQKAKNFTTPEEQVNEIMSYFDNITSAQAKK